MKTEINEMTVNGEVYVKKSSVVSQKQFDGNLVIAVLQRGWVFVGRLQKNGTDCILRDAHNIRTWGTTKGLGELAECGALAGTKLDKCNGFVKFHELTLLFTISCDESKWKI